MKFMRNTRLSSSLLVLLMGCVSLSACATPPKHDQSQFSYTVSLDADGNLTVLDRYRKPVKAQKISGPVDAKKIVRVRSITIIEVEGSHFLEIVIDGTPYKVPLPD